MYHFPAPILNRKIRFALVGCGRIAQNHFAAIKQHGDHAELVGVCDTNPSALADAVKTTGAKPFKSLKEMLANCDADVFILTTPSGLHPEQAIEIAKAGRNVITEKPMANTVWQMVNAW